MISHDRGRWAAFRWERPPKTLKSLASTIGKNLPSASEAHFCNQGHIASQLNLHKAASISALA